MSTLKMMVTSYFEGLIEGSFKTAADGQRLFYPWGVLGKGYILPDAHAEQRICKVLKVYYMLSLPLVIITVSTVVSIHGYYYALASIPVVLLAYVVGVLWRTQGLHGGRERLRVRESLVNSGRAHNGAILWLLFIVSTVFVIGGIVLVLDRQVAMGVLNILIFGACSSVFGYMLRMRG